MAAIRVMPGLVDVGFLGWMACPLPVRLAFHLSLAVVLLAAALAVALTALAAQLVSWHLVGWASERHPGHA